MKRKGSDVCAKYDQDNIFLEYIADVFLANVDATLKKYHQLNLLYSLLGFNTYLFLRRILRLPQWNTTVMHI